MIVFFVLGLLACCGASFYLGVRVAQANIDVEEEKAWVKTAFRLSRDLETARGAGRRLAAYWKRKVV